MKYAAKSMIVFDFLDPAALTSQFLCEFPEILGADRLGVHANHLALGVLRRRVSDVARDHSLDSNNVTARVEGQGQGGRELVLCLMELCEGAGCTRAMHHPRLRLTQVAKCLLTCRSRWSS